MSLQSIEDVFNDTAISMCEYRREEFDKDFNFCPFCSKELKKQSIPFNIEKDNSITAEWNNEKTWISDKEIFIPHPNFSGIAMINIFKFKERLDDKLLELGLNPYERFT